jgi:hypothetical protein
MTDNFETIELEEPPDAVLSGETDDSKGGDEE